MSNNKAAWALLAVIGAGFVWGLVQLYDLRLASGDIYPAYSSLRGDPLGSKVLFESVAQLPGYSARRNFQPLDELHGAASTLLWIGEDPFTFALLPEENLKEFEQLASGGFRIVIAMTPVKPIAPHARMEAIDSALEKRWGITFAYVKKSQAQTAQPEPRGGLPKRTALIIKTGGAVTPIAEKRFGTGCVLLADNAYSFSNESLAGDRNTALLARVLGPNRTVLFDEHHLGLSETSSIAMLARRYRLTGLLAGLLVLAALFIWRNSSPLLPPRREAAPGEARLIRERDSASALEHLLERNIPVSALIPACIAEWEKTGRDGRSFAPEKLAILRQLAEPASKRTPVEIYRTIQSVITQRER